MKKTVLILAGVFAIIALAGCATPDAVEGPPGPAGPPGPKGAAGPPSQTLDAQYVGSDTCGMCHVTIYDNFMLSGHPYKLNPVIDDQPPTYPFSEIPDPPEGYSWEDIAYVIGGYGWKARFINQDGYIITGDADALTQYNLYNDDLKMGDTWSEYHAGEELAYNCGSCHTTGYSNWPSGQNQDDLPGLIGTWALPGIQCEACHGPSSLHVNEPENLLYRPKVNRDADLCGECHIRGDEAQIDASGSFVNHHEQYEDYYQSKHRSLNCVDCHNPHATTLYREEAVAQGMESGVAVECNTCHWQQDTFRPTNHRYGECIDCHMPPLAKSALGDDEKLRGDVSSHLFSINAYTLEQFYEEDGVTYSYSYITVPYACSRCHYDGVMQKDINLMMEMARGFHDPDRAGFAPATEEAEPTE